MNTDLHWHMRRQWAADAADDGQGLVIEHEHGEYTPHAHDDDGEGGWEMSFHLDAAGARVPPEEDEPIVEELQLEGTGDTASREELITAELSTWWETYSQQTLERTVPKAVRYGSKSMEMLGSALAMMVPRERRSRKLALQMACCMYAFGKLGRAWAALLRGEDPDHDDWFDLEIYARMGAHVAEKGEWVG